MAAADVDGTAFKKDGADDELEEDYRGTTLAAGFAGCGRLRF